MAILAEWKNTLEMFKPKNLKLLSLATLNAFKQAYKTVVFNFGWWALAFATLLFVVGGAVMFVINAVTPDLNFVISVPWDPLHAYIRGLAVAIYYCVIFLWCVTIRPSVERKQGRYFLSFIKQFLYLFPLYFFYFALGYWILRIDPVYILAPHTSIYGGLLLAVLSIFFALDSDGSFKRVMRAYGLGLQMLIYALPAWVGVALLYRLLAWIIWQGRIALNYDYAWHRWYENMSFYVLSLLIVPFFVCIMSVIYTKKVHDNSELYN